MGSRLLPNTRQQPLASMFPKRSNPWLLAQSTAIVSRAQVEDGGEGGKARNSTGEGLSGLLAALDELASRSVFGLKRENEPDHNDVRKRKKRRTEMKEEKKRAGANDGSLSLRPFRESPNIWLAFDSPTYSLPPPLVQSPTHTHIPCTQTTAFIQVSRAY
jgi:hypothetical protein